VKKNVCNEADATFGTATDTNEHIMDIGEVRFTDFQSENDRLENVAKNNRHLTDDSFYASGLATDHKNENHQYRIDHKIESPFDRRST
jgi:hypothetical protein